MPLPSSGAISLNQMHVEAGGSSGTQVSINDSDIRDMISKGSGVQMSFNEWYGASAGPTIERNYSLDTTGNSPQTNIYAAWGYFYHPYGFGNWSSSIWNPSGVYGDYQSDGWSPTGKTHDRAFHLMNYTSDFGADSNIGNSSLHYVKSNCPFPAISGSIGGWYYYEQRNDGVVSGFTGGDGYAGGGVAYFYNNRTDSSSYPL